MGKVYLFSLVANGIIFVGFVLAVVGTATNGWVQYAGIDIGISLADGQDMPTGKAAYAMCVLCTLFAAGALVAVSVDVYLQYSDKINDQTTVLIPRAVSVAGIAGGIFGVIGTITHAAWFAANTASSIAGGYVPGYSWFLTIIGSFGLIAGGALDFRSRNGRQIQMSPS